MHDNDIRCCHVVSVLFLDAHGQWRTSRNITQTKPTCRHTVRTRAPRMAPTAFLSALCLRAEYVSCVCARIYRHMYIHLEVSEEALSYFKRPSSDHAICFCAIEFLSGACRDDGVQFCVNMTDSFRSDVVLWILFVIHCLTARDGNSGLHKCWAN